MTDYSTRNVTAEDYDAMYALWNSAEQSRRALNPVDDSREGMERYLKRFMRQMRQIFKSAITQPSLQFGNLKN